MHVRSEKEGKKSKKEDEMWWITLGPHRPGESERSWCSSDSAVLRYRLLSRWRAPLGGREQWSIEPWSLVGIERLVDCLISVIHSMPRRCMYI